MTLRAIRRAAAQAARLASAAQAAHPMDPVARRRAAEARLAARRASLACRDAASASTREEHLDAKRAAELWTHEATTAERVLFWRYYLPPGIRTGRGDTP